MQWSRRKRELDAFLNGFNDYHDECIEKGIYPTPYGLVGYYNAQPGNGEDRAAWEYRWESVVRLAAQLVDDPGCPKVIRQVCRKVLKT